MAHRLVGLGFAVIALGWLAPPAMAAPARTLGFVATLFTHAAYDGGAADCPDGLNASAIDVYLAAAPEAERARLNAGTEGRRELNRLLSQGASLTDRMTPNACNTPTDYMKPGYFDPNYKTITRGGVAFGMDLDGATGSEATATSCAHQPFTGPAGEAGVDNQWWRLMGCVKYYRPGGDITEGSPSGIKSGAVSILVEVSGVDDVRDDPQVEVAFYSSSDPAPTGSNGEVMPGGSFQPHENSRFHAHARGAIKNGVLTTEPVEIHLQKKLLIVDTEWFFRDARLRLEVQADGTAKGLLAGYFDVDTAYDTIRQQHMSTAVLGGYTCPSLYVALHRLADGNRDPESGQCRGISTAYAIQMVPAFIVHPKTRTADSGR